MNFKCEKASEAVPSAANKKQRFLILENDPAGIYVRADVHVLGLVLTH